jgi:shikimate dehydrogenase
MTLAIQNIIKNSEPVLVDQTEYYAAIIGESPSRGAKSPSLWNAAFEALGISAKMHPFDIDAPDLESLIKELRQNPQFIGGAVTMPHKQLITKYLDELEPEAKAIGAVNCIYRKGNQLIGANTDGAGALASLEEAYGKTELSQSNVLICGLGGAGSAIAAYIAGALNENQTLILTNRNERVAQDLASRLSSKCQIKTIVWPPKAIDVSDISIIINATSIGFENAKQDERGTYYLNEYTPLAEVDDSIRIPNASATQSNYNDLAKQGIETNQEQSLALLASQKELFVFDIIYQPEKTTLLKLAEGLDIKFLNGAIMNLEQAVIAFYKATETILSTQASQESIRQSMKPLW